MQTPFIIVQNPAQNISFKGTGKNNSEGPGNFNGGAQGAGNFFSVFAGTVNEQNYSRIKVLSENGLNISESLSEDELQVIIETFLNGVFDDTGEKKSISMAGFNLDSKEFAENGNKNYPDAGDKVKQLLMDQLFAKDASENGARLIKEIIAEVGTNKGPLLTEDVPENVKNDKAVVLLGALKGMGKNNRAPMILEESAAKDKNNKLELLLKQLNENNKKNNTDSLLLKQLHTEDGNNEESSAAKEIIVKAEDNKEALLLKQLSAKDVKSEKNLLPAEAAVKNEDNKNSSVLKQLFVKDENNKDDVLLKHSTGTDEQISDLKKLNRKIPLNSKLEPGDKSINDSMDIKVKRKFNVKEENNKPEIQKDHQKYPLNEKASFFQDGVKNMSEKPAAKLSGVADYPDNKNNFVKVSGVADANGEFRGNVPENTDISRSYVNFNKEMAGDKDSIEKTGDINTDYFGKKITRIEPDNKDNMSFLNSRSSNKAMEEVLSEKVGKPFQKPDQANIMGQIVKKAVLDIKNGQKSIKISLKPEYLGRLELRVSIDNHQVVLKMLTETPMVKDVIENNIAHLKTELGNHGLEIDKFEVQVGENLNYEKKGHEKNENFQLYTEKKNGKDSEQEMIEEPEKSILQESGEKSAGLVGVFA